MDSQSMSDEKNILSPKEMRWLLMDLKDEDPSLGIRLKLVHHGWQSVFHKIIHVSETNIVLLDEKSVQLKFISLADVLQFSTTRKVKKTSIHSHYELRAN